MTTNSDEKVNQEIDCKGPLKGKGATLAQWEQDVTRRLTQVYSDMSTLSSESRAIDGRSFGLYVIKLRDAKQLRWRTTKSQHVTWQRIEPRLAQLPQGLAAWYRQAEEVAQVLNHREQALRYELKTVQRLAQRGPMEVRQYKGAVGKGFGGGRPSTKRQDAAGGGAEDGPRRKARTAHQV